jgi:uncharacterized protein YecE (DUF72 family)
MSARIHIGTSGWYYKHWRGLFYSHEMSAADMLTHYVKEFDTVEINNTFYALPAPDTPRKWREKTPPDFMFAVKASRFLTHVKRLKDSQEALDRFLAVIEPLAEKSGPILFQLPPRWKSNAERLESFLASLPSNRQYSFEFRDPSWHHAQIYDLLRKYNVAFCLTNKGDQDSSIEVTANFTYVRFHGGAPELRGNYTMESLQRWRQRIDLWRNELTDIYVYFNNDWEGFALNNARELKQMLGLL